MELKGEWSCIVTDTGLPIEGKTESVIGFVRKFKHTIKEVHYTGPDGAKCFEVYSYLYRDVSTGAE